MNQLGLDQPTLLQVTLSVGDPAPAFSYLPVLVNETGTLPTYTAGYLWTMGGAVSDPDDEPDFLMDGVNSVLWPYQYQHVYDAEQARYRTDAPVRVERTEPVARYKVRAVLAREHTASRHYVHKATQTRIWNNLMAAVADYFTLPGTEAEAMRTPRLHPLRVPVNTNYSGVFPNRLNASNRMNPVPVRTFPWQTLVGPPFNANSPEYAELSGYLMLDGIDFIGESSSAPDQSDLDFLGVTIDPQTGEYRFNIQSDPVTGELVNPGGGVIPRITFGEDIFLTEQAVPGNTEFIDSGGVRSFRNDVYPLYLAHESTITAGATPRILTVDTPIIEPHCCPNKAIEHSYNILF